MQKRGTGRTGGPAIDEPPAIGADVTRFIDRYIRALDDLDALLLLRRCGRALTVQQVAAELRTSAGSAESALESFAAGGFARRDGDRYSYRPSPEVAALVADLADAYLARPTRVIGLIFAVRQNRE